MSIPSPASHTHDEGAHPERKTSLWTLALGSIGVVYGDIGTSPLYAVKESLNAARGSGQASTEMVFGVMSLMLWALFVIVTLKYIVIMLRADNHGEGGTLSLMALAQRAIGDKGRWVPLLGIAGAALFYGDAMITPAISVLSAVEGLELVTPDFNPYVIPISIAILVALFAIQSRGTARVAEWFGPIILIWFVAIAAGGIAAISENPEIFLAINPLYGISFVSQNGVAGLIALGAVFLAVTGAEALYADLGHFGRRPIRMAWLYVVFPSLVLNYLGQGARLIVQPEAIENPFFRLYPGWALLPMIILATIATIIASQAVITGAYSVTQQAIQLGLLPRLDIRRTSETERGQIYMPAINWILLIAVIYLVGSFRTSSALASAYGIAVTGTMVVTVMLATIVARRVWGWSVTRTAVVMAPLFVIDAVFLGANALKIVAGGWLPILVGASLIVVMLSWRRGSEFVASKTRRENLSVEHYLPTLLERSDRVPGTAIFLTAHPESVPTALMHNLKHNKILHRRNIFVAVDTADTPRIAEAERGSVKRLDENTFIVHLCFGFMEEPDVPRALARRRLGLHIIPLETSYYLSRRALRPATRSPMPYWQSRLFVALAHHATDASQYFRIPTDRAIEIGTQIAV